jgi:hypothetical protein
MYCIVKSVYSNGVRNYYLIVAKEKIPRIERLKTYKSIVHADEVYPVTVLTISYGKEDSIWKKFIVEVPQDEWMSIEEFEKWVGIFTEKLRRDMVDALHRKLEYYPVPEKPKGRAKIKYPKIIDYYYRYAPYKKMVAMSLKKKAKESYSIGNLLEIYRFSRSFAIDYDGCMVFLPYDVNEIDADRLSQCKWSIISVINSITDKPEYSSIPEDIRSVIDYVYLFVNTL